MRGPLSIKEFETFKKYYVYSSFLNNIYEVRRDIYDIIQNYIKPIKNNILGSNKSSLDNKIKKVLEKLNKELFYSLKPKKLVFFENKKAIIDALDNSLQQLTLEITENCNMKCVYCINSGLFRYHRAYSSKSMDFLTAKKSVDYFIPRANDLTHNPIIGFYGGEPLLEINLIRRIISYINRYYSNKKITYLITTNGTLITKDMIKYLIDNNIRLSISLDGPKYIHDRNRIFTNGKGTFLTIKRNLLKIKSIDHKYFDRNLCFQSVFCPPFYYRDVINFFINDEMFSRNNVFIQNYVMLDNSSVVLPHYDDEDRFIDELYLARLKRDYFLGRKKSQKNNYLSSLFTKDISRIHTRQKGYRDHFLNNISTSGICLPGKRRLYVDSSGYFHTCERVEKSIPIGQVNDGFNIDQIIGLINEYSRESEMDCCNCWAFRLCDICYTSAIRGGKIDIEYKRQNCERERKKILGNLVTYMSIIEEKPGLFNEAKYSN